MGKIVTKFLRRMMFSVVIILLVTILGAFSVFAATYYVDPNVPDDSGTGNVANPKKYITSGILLMTGGDTLILKDGTYMGQNNMIGDYANPQVYLPSGSAGNFTTIRAENTGKAIIDAQYLRPAFSQGSGPTYRNYLHVDGIHFKNGFGGLFSIAGNNNWVSNCGFEDGQPYTDDSETPIAFVAGGSSYTLIEDSWVWGKGRYGFYTGSVNGGTHHVIFRRVVVRLDAVPSGWMSAGLRFYNSNTNAMQNCIVIDSLTDSNSAANGTCAQCWSFAQGGGSSVGEWDHIFDGNIALNNPYRGGFSNEKGYLPSTETWKNSVFWGLNQGFFPYNLVLNSGYGTSGQNVWSVINMLIGNSVVGINLTSTRANEAYNISNSIFTGNTTSAFGNTGFRLDRSINNVIASNNGSNTCNVGDGCITTNLDMATNPLTNIVRYLPRIESGVIGPTIKYQIGGTGTFHGDAGWSTANGIPLWPYPNEQLWSVKMKAYNVNTVSGNRGFAALNTSTPLTNYIWGYLGNTVPPFNLTATPATNTSITLNWSPNTANNNITKYKVYVGNSSGNYNVPGYNGKDVGLATTETLAGLNANTLYYVSVTAVDGTIGESGYSYEIITNTLDTTKPVTTFTMPTTANSLTVNFNSFSATDNVSVTGYMITLSPTSPASGDSGWSLTPTTSYTFATAGNKTLYPWAKDAAGNVSVGQSHSVTINLSSPPSAPASSSGGGGCFIATAAYGSYLHPQVQALRNFRDTYLLTNRPGRAFVALYYHFSPPIADFIAQHETFRLMVRLLLTPIVLAFVNPELSILIILLIPVCWAIRRRWNMKEPVLGVSAG